MLPTEVLYWYRAITVCRTLTNFEACIKIYLRLNIFFRQGHLARYGARCLQVGSRIRPIDAPSICRFPPGTSVLIISHIKVSTYDTVNQ